MNRKANEKKKHHHHQIPFLRMQRIAILTIKWIFFLFYINEWMNEYNIYINIHKKKKIYIFKKILYINNNIF